MARESLKRRVADSSEKDKAESILADVENFAALEALGNSEGGKILVESLLSDALNDIESLTGGYKKLSHIELLSLCASLEKSLDTVRAIKRASKNKNMAKDALEEIIGE